MTLADLRRAGHAPSLLAGLLHLDVSFMAWVLFGALGAYVGEDLGLSPGEKGLLVTMPLLAGVFFRVALGVLNDRVGPRRTGIASMAATTVPLAWVALGGGTYGELLAAGLLLGVAGGSFAISLPLASASYPLRHQGLVMGIVGAGNSGTVITTLFAPRMAEQIGWQAVFGLAIVPVALGTGAFALLAKDPPARTVAGARPRARALLRETDMWRLCAFYALSFGGFVGFASFLPILLHDAYGLSKVDAATVAAAGAIAGSLLRPLGGYAADRVGGTLVLSVAYAAAGTCLTALVSLPALAVGIAGFVTAMGLFGIGNGATFQLVGLRYGHRVGLATGVVGAAGGVGGFLLPTMLSLAEETAGGYEVGLAAVALALFGGALGIVCVRGGWRERWSGVAEARI